MKYLPGSRVRFCVFALLFAAGLAAAQDSAVTSACGKAKVTLDHPEYLTDALGIIVAEPPVVGQFGFSQPRFSIPPVA